MTINSILKPKKKYKLKRIGGFGDGGYIIGENSLKKAETVISFGIDDDWEFEKEFLQNNINCVINCYDYKPILKYLINRFVHELVYLPAHPRLKFIKYFNKIIDFLKVRKKINIFQKNIFYGDLNEMLNNISNENIFLKIDIEGSEYRVLEEIIENQKKIIGIAIEFHDFDYHKNVIYDFCKRLNLDLVHIHPCNASPVDKNGDPLVIELTFEKNPIIVGDNPTLPIKEDRKNDPTKEDIKLNFN